MSTFLDTNTCPVPRVSRACNRCRIRKVRCIPSEDPKTCRRCYLQRFECIAIDSSQQKRDSSNRKARRGDTSRQGNGFVVDVADGSLNGSNLGFAPHVGRVGQHGEDTQTPRDGALDLSSFHSAALSRLFDNDEKCTTIPSIGEREARPNKNNSTSLDTSALDTSRISSYVESFLEVKQDFPFVNLPKVWTVQLLRRDHPFLLLSILSAMTFHDTALNSQLHAQFLRVLAERTVVRGEKNLDLIQGMLVQIAWYPMHLNPLRAQIFQVVHLAISMMADLHWNRPDASLDRPNGLLCQGDCNLNEIHSIQSALVGCYYLSSIAAISFLRRNDLPFTEYMEGCISDLAFSNSDDDPGLRRGLHLVRLQRLTEQANDAIYGKGHTVRPSKTSLEDLLVQLDKIRAEAPSTIQHDPYITLATYHAEMQVNSIALPRKQQRWVSHPGDSDGNWRPPALERCLAAGKVFLETFLSFEMSEYRKMNFAHWAYLIQALKIVSRLCFNIPGVPSWDSTEARKVLQFGIILESLCYRMQELTVSEPYRSLATRAVNRDAGANDGLEKLGRVAPPDHFYLFKSVLQILKKLYDERVKATSVKTLAQDGLSRSKSSCPVLNGDIHETEFWDAYETCTFPDNEFAWFLNDDVGDFDLGGVSGLA